MKQNMTVLTRGQRWWALGAIGAAVWVIAATLSTTTHEVPPVRLDARMLAFDPARAMAYTRRLSTMYPGRVTGTQASRRAARYIETQFRALGYAVHRQRFALWYRGQRVMGENVVATLPNATTGPYVAVLSHYDSPVTAPNSAEDDASGVGTMLELARSTRTRIARPIFVAADAEEVGMLGAAHLVRYLHTQGTGSALSIDYINAGEVRGLQTYASGQFSGYSPLRLREIARAAQAQQTAFVQYPHGLSEWIDRAVDRSFQDQGPLLHAGIPAIDVCTIPLDRSAAMTRYHTTADVYANFLPSAFAITGRSVERTMLTLDKQYPSGVDGFLLTSSRYVPLDAMWLVQFAGLVPLLLVMLVVSWNMGVRVLSNMAHLAALAAPAVAAYALVAQLAQHNIMLPRFELYPAPPKDPSLYHPSVSIVLALACVLASGYAIVSRWRTPVFDKATLFAGTIAVLLAAFAIQPYGMWLYLSIFGYAALLFVERSGRVPLAINLTLCALAALPFAAVLWFYANDMWLGPYVLWYLVLQAAYGTWSFRIAGIVICAAVLWVQYVRLALANAPAWTPSTLPKPRPAAPMSGSAAS